MSLAIIYPRACRDGIILATSRTPPALGSWWLQPPRRRAITTVELDRKRDGRERIVILGSGWAGYTIARRIDRKKYQAVVVSPRSYFVFTPLLASTSVGTLEFRTAVEPVRTKYTGVSYFQGLADSVDFKNNTVTILGGLDNYRQYPDAPQNNDYADNNRLFNLKYEKLIISTGCLSQTFGIPGVKEHALFLKNVGDARKIRTRLLACFETAALPITSERVKKYLLNFAIVGGGPTGIEFSAELHDIIREDLSKLYPDLVRFCKITVYDVAPKVLPMFDEKLGTYAMEHFKREGISIKTSHHVEELRQGPPTSEKHCDDTQTCFTIKVREEGEIGVGMVVWSTGNMMNPFVRSLSKPQLISHDGNPNPNNNINNEKWAVKKQPKTGSLVVSDRLRVVLELENGTPGARTELGNVFALGDCASVEGTAYPATAQVANQQAQWLSKRLNTGDINQHHFTWKNMGIMAYVGNWRAIMQSGNGTVSGRTAWLIWRGAYLTKSVSLRNKILIPMYWFINWAFGRDISRF